MNTDWTKPNYPGDAVRIALLIRGDEIGDVRIQDYGHTAKLNRFCVNAFLTGETQCSPGDTPKTWSDLCAWCATPGEANSTFLEFVRSVKADGWADYDCETGKAA